jgi:putative transposase
MSNRSHSELYYHFVWSTFERKPLIDTIWEYRLYSYIVSKCRTRGCIPLAIGGIEDHTHMLLRAQPEMIPADIIGRLKGSSSHYVNSDILPGTHFSWQEGYGIFSVCPNHIDNIIRYIRNQKENHRTNELLLDFEKINIEDSTIDADDEQIPECIIGY